VFFLNSMTKYSALDWFKCDGCDHIFTMSRDAQDNAPTTEAE